MFKKESVQIDYSLFERTYFLQNPYSWKYFGKDYNNDVGNILS